MPTKKTKTAYGLYLESKSTLMYSQWVASKPSELENFSWPHGQSSKTSNVPYTPRETSEEAPNV